MHLSITTKLYILSVFHTKTPDSKSSSTLMVVLFFAKRLALMAAIFSTDIASLKDLQINIRGKNWIKLRNQLFMTLGTNLRLMKGKSTPAMAFREYNLWSVHISSRTVEHSSNYKWVKHNTLPDLFSGNSSLLVPFKSSFQPFLR